ncbi:synaptotagmin-like protein 2 [Aplysia californica]|uniref:Synaptotagmin-like protein 2 n=1 Tax=Aplysia californica TaxID=6500 RepID=A0ABM0JZW1_APLCA|nr:synaptotagmin-like protein 2 [Aplysia californica]
MGTTDSKLPPGPNAIRQDPNKIELIAKALDVRAERQRQLEIQDGWDRLEQDKQSLQSLKSLFKKLDPTVVKSPTDVNGEIELSFKFDEKRQLLLVKVIKCRDLHAKDVRRKASDPYVRLQLYPDLHSHGAKVTQIVVESRNPVYNEIFAFKIRPKELADTKLVVQVFDYDCVTRDDFLGEVVVELSQFNFQTEPVLTAWYTLCMETDLSITGDLEISLNFLKPQSLFLTVHGAYGLSRRQDGKPVHAMVKCTVPGSGSVHKTQVVVADDGNPDWQETFEFEIPEEELEFRYVLLHVLDNTAHTEHNMLGQIIIDLDTLNTEGGYNGWLKLADLRNSDRLRNKQQQHKVTQEFREAFRAHAFARYPSFLFQQQMGKKSVTVTCRKAGAQGKIQMMDGVPVF